MKPTLPVCIVSLTTLVAAMAHAQTISGVEEREAFLERSERLEPISVGNAMNRFAGTVNPFNPDAPTVMDRAIARTAEEGARRAAGPSEREVLVALAERVRPTGSMTVGSEQILLFGERRVRAGDVLQLSYQGVSYRVTVGAIGPRSYLLRLGQEEISKPVQ